jgi:outer membrane lipopolysaccharide assembly protein LptE/RlpB
MKAAFFRARAFQLSFGVLASLLLVSTGCGYHVAGHSSALPKNIQVIAVTPLENKTTSYRIEQKLTSATVHEFLAATHYKVVSNAQDGDAVLRDNTSATSTSSGRATTMVVTVKCEVSLTDSVSGKVLYHNENFLFRNEYEVSTDVKSFFEEQDPALDRLAQDFARRLVAAVVENY